MMESCFNDDVNLSELFKLLIEWTPDFKNVVYIANSGNAGDALIASATMQVFRKLKVTPKLGRCGKLPRNANVILGGGGNLIPLYASMAKLIEECIEKEAKSVLLLPHTIRGNEPLLNKLDARFSILCRDIESFELVKKANSQCKAYLVPDMAFHLDLTELREFVASFRHKVALMFDKQWIFQFFRWRLALNRQLRGESKKLLILRSDNESASMSLQNRATDLPRHFKIRANYSAACDQVSFDLLNLISSSTEVESDRLHICIPSLLLGKKTKVLDNNYGKVVGVIELGVKYKPELVSKFIIGKHE